MADVNLTHTGAQLDAAIATVLAAGGGGGGAWSSAIGTGECDSSGNAEITGLSFTPKVVFMSINVEGTEMPTFFEYIDSAWVVSVNADNWRFTPYTIIEAGNGYINFTGLSVANSAYAYTVWGS